MLALRLLAAVVFLLVALVALSMAWKGLSAQRLLPFHQAATGRDWTDGSAREQATLVALTQGLGLGFLAAAVALVAAAALAVADDPVGTYALAFVGLVFCTGLAVVNRRLARATAVTTPWKGALYAAAAIVVAAVLYAIG